jgi:hypothetical protein
LRVFRIFLSRNGSHSLEEELTISPILIFDLC